MEASLTCAVCLSLFEEPVTLPLCSHNFCRACLVECLGLGQPTAERPSSAVASTSSRQPPRPRSYELLAVDRGQPPGSSARAPRPGSGSGGPVTVSCPLCRKLCPLPRDGGAAALPVNTTLAEVVKLFRAAHGDAAAAEEAEAEGKEASALVPQLAALGERCQKHPDRALQLYCRLCCRGGCGQCVSEEHRGVFHSVNLIDTVYQEEKLAFFSNLKKLRTVHLKLMKEIITYSNDAEAMMQNEEDIIEMEFEKICKALATRKKQLLDDLESQRKRKEKECQIWKRMKEVHRKTIENVLNDSEKLVNECDPQRFLEVACSLNQRMKTQLDLMQMASRHENQSECRQMQMDTTSVVNDILALKLTAVDLDAVKDVPSGENEHFVFANTENKWEDQRSEQNISNPMAGEDSILDNGSITSAQSALATTESESMSYEEARYNHYLAHGVQTDELQTQISAQNEKLTLPKPLPSSITTLESPLSFLSAEANQNALKIPMSQRQVVNESSFSNSLDFTFSAPATNLNFSVSNNVFNLKKSPKDGKKTSLSEKATNILKPIPPSHAAALPFGAQPSLTIFSNLPQSAPPSASAIKFHSPGDSVQHPASPFLFSSSGSLTSYATKGSAPSFKTKNPFFTVFLGEPESQDYNLNSINGYNASTIVSPTTATTITTMSFPTASLSIGAGPGSPMGKFRFSVQPTSSQNAPFQTATLNSSQQALFPTIQKTVEENKATSFTKEHNLGHGWFTPPAVSKQLGGNSSCIPNVACKSANFTFEKADASKKQSVLRSLSPNNCWTSNTPCLFTFKGGIKNSCDHLTSSTVPFYKTKHVHKEKVDTPKSAISSKNNIPVYKNNLISSSFFFSTGKSQKSENESTVLVSPKLHEESHLPLEDSPNTEDHIGFPSLTNEPPCVSNADSDVEDLSQASNSSDCSCTSEYFSVAEDKILPS